MNIPALLIALLAVAIVGGGPAGAESSWESIRREAFDDRPIHDGKSIMTLEAPSRPEDLRAVPMSLSARLTDGRSIKSATFIVDENPSPVAAVFRLGPGRDELNLATNIRLNAQSEVRVVIEASDGRLYMVDRLVKFAGGQAACAAPPSGDPSEIAARMGRIDIAEAALEQSMSPRLQRAKLTLNHPNHTGMVLDQITLLYVPLRIVTEVEVTRDGEPVIAMTGSMTLSQDPTIDFDFKNEGAGAFDVVMRDSSGAEWKASVPVGGGS